MTNPLVAKSGIPTFTTKRLSLRPVNKADIPAYTRYFVDYEVIRHLSAAVPWPYPENGVADYILNRLLPQQGHDRWAWAITLQPNPAKLIGLVDLWRPGTPENRGFWLGRPFWGQGIMTEAVTPVVDYAFDQLGFEKLVFSNARGNIASRRVKEKTGARFIGIQPAAFVDPQYTERELWELTKEMWHEYRATLKL
ncbi:MAG: GNAT family N-acetyltransferase [Chloroflexota bacterium]